MKTIKNYKFIMLLAVVSLFFSCENDGASVEPASMNIQIVVEAFVNSQIELTGQAGSNNANIELGFKLTENSTYNGSDVTITYEGNEYVIPAGENEVIVGVTNIEFELGSPGGDIPYEGVSMTSEINLGDYFEVTVGGRPSDLVVIKSGSIIINATVYNRLPQTNENSVELLLDWENPSQDVDLYFSLGDANANYLGYFDNSGSVSRYEEISLPIDASYDDSSILAPNNYYVDIYTRWISGYPSINYKLFIAYPDGTLEIIDGSTEDGQSRNLNILTTKTTNVDTGNAEFVFGED